MRSGCVSSSPTSSTSSCRGAGPSRSITASRSAIQPAASKNGRMRAPARSSWTSSLRCGESLSSASAACTRSTGSRSDASPSTRTKFASQKFGADGVRRTEPCAHGSTTSHCKESCECRHAIAAALRGSVFGVVLAPAGAADHDLVFLDRDLDGTVARPVLGVHGIILDGGVQPQAVPFLAVVERALERARGRGATARAATAAPGGTLGFLVVFGIIGGGCSSLLLGSLARGLFGGARRLLGLASGFGFELGGDLRVVLRAQVDLLGGRAVLLEVG